MAFFPGVYLVINLHICIWSIKHVIIRVLVFHDRWCDDREWIILIFLPLVDDRSLRGCTSRS
ncbi:hypothetical protein FOMG_01025 [Fusarium oxysporum f. sp. melonis 26406]|uniref:Uncharacterized protein n=1 Tax=Fusarium oxysporum f. sp. melonis 26406 TaxID=1089452 RepID=X0BS92_FUSOX|nr:hypothetical protein FOMG_01025 [Fusarium oxysporum f. sp. melonis 26406]